MFVFNKKRFTSDDSQSCIEKHIELCAVKIDTKSSHIDIVCVYRSPTGKYSQFLNLLNSTLKYLYKPNTEFLICGDIM
jgi:hypothetical protein